jgi:hypothetical protein
MERSGTETTIAVDHAVRGDDCASCGARLAPDQRYCVDCGERRGAPRFAFMDGRTPAPDLPRTAEPQRRQRPSAGLTLIAGICTLLVAIGVGVLIGRSDGGQDQPVAAAPVQVVTVGGAPAAGASTTASDAATSTTPSPASTTATTGTTATSTAKATSTAAQPAVTVGSSGKGRGYNKEGKFTGDFFGGG